ncbi:MAG: S8 family serine peptidase [Actinobacteria bacterium]|uniref:Unannotated protein n=1 Tax=freshwater metagenome TaxID=449393 RepID=A0A6J5ZXI7_9ZZZZ|nr:S8 family serine peptidase [Actinomycetota bacterium]
MSQRPVIRLTSAFAGVVGAALASAAVAGASPIGAPPMVLPASGSQAAAGTGWIVGAAPGGRSAAIARSFGAKPIAGLPAFSTRRADARPLAAALAEQGLLRYAEPDVKLRRQSAFEGHLDSWARGAVVPSSLQWPAAGGVPVAVLDDRVDGSVADLADQTQWLNSAAMEEGHGTMVASTISAAVGHGGVVGVFPETPILSFGLHSFTCAEVARGIDSAIAAGARIINMSLGTTSRCFSMYSAIQRAYAKNVLSVAAAGNEYQEGNPTEYPAAFPHVISVAATDSQGRVSSFSNANTAVDVSAPGVNVPVDVPLVFDTEDGARNGTSSVDGTSFSSPITAGAAAWIAAARPSLQAGQIADVLRRSATDIAPSGYDSNSGFGLINIPAALAQETPTIDPREPNDDASFVNGTALGVPSPYLWTGAAPAELTATIDEIKDPVDVYPIRIPPRTSARISVAPKFGNPDLAVYSARATTVAGSRYRLKRSHKSGTKVDSVRIANSSYRPLRSYIVVTDTDRKLLNAAYTLRVRR